MENIIKQSARIGIGLILIFFLSFITASVSLSSDSQVPLKTKRSSSKRTIPPKEDVHGKKGPNVREREITPASPQAQLFKHFYRSGSEESWVVADPMLRPLFRWDEEKNHLYIPLWMLEGSSKYAPYELIILECSFGKTTLGKMDLSFQITPPAELEGLKPLTLQEIKERIENFATLKEAYEAKSKDYQKDVFDKLLNKIKETKKDLQERYHKLEEAAQKCKLEAQEIINATSSIQDFSSEPSLLKELEYFPQATRFLESHRKSVAGLKKSSDSAKEKLAIAVDILEKLKKLDPDAYPVNVRVKKDYTAFEFKDLSIKLRPVEEKFDTLNNQMKNLETKGESLKSQEQEKEGEEEEVSVISEEESDEEEIYSF